MSRKLSIGGVAIGFAMFLATLAPVAAQAAEPQWYGNNKVLPATHTTSIAWREIQFESGAVGKIHCMNVMNMTVWNEGGHGLGQFEGWGTNACLAPELEET